VFQNLKPTNLVHNHFLLCFAWCVPTTTPRVDLSSLRYRIHLMHHVCLPPAIQHDYDDLPAPGGAGGRFRLQ
jgi:hypothetical protein